MIPTIMDFRAWIMYIIAHIQWHVVINAVKDEKDV